MIIIFAIRDFRTLFGASRMDIVVYRLGILPPSYPHILMNRHGAEVRRQKRIMAPRKATPKKRPLKKRATGCEMDEVWKSTRHSVKALIETLSKGIESPQTMPEHWERLFGTKDSAVANLQKLVGLLIELRQHFHETHAEDATELTRVETHELEMLEAWLSKQRTTGDDA